MIPEFSQGTQVCYRGINGTISFCSDNQICILIKKGDLRFQDVTLVVTDFSEIYSIDEK
jgi:hypothetical protein